MAALIEATGGQPPPEAFVDAVYEVSEGNPFFVAEILRNLVESGAIRVEDGRYVGDPESIAANLPEGVREVVGRRLDRLSEEANALLSVGSAMPGGFDLDICASVAGFDIDRALDLLDEALAATVLTERAAAPGTYEFNHALIRQALYSELSTPRRVRMHQRIGEAIEAKHADRLDPHLTELAYHFFQAAPAGEAERARLRPPGGRPGAGGGGLRGGRPLLRHGPAGDRPGRSDRTCGPRRHPRPTPRGHRAGRHPVGRLP